MTTQQFIQSAVDAKNQQELDRVIYTVAGVDNRFVRQKICNELTGESIPLVKCGISHLAQYFMEYMAPKAKPAPKADVPTQETKEIVVGLKVTRKECKREGVIAAIEGDKLSITLADGTVRNPNINRFQRLYTF
jgi:hypothetical protein